ncbi:alpha/beta hydrolase [Anaerosporobacter sp.]|uniref:alpha/beta hydrolase n=1 Tax=Anaerosporobacter sp. TaxID=1872529 RepID=UPI00286ECAED|nr:alpha/beta hydrolase [Anaerosporobacter sp.]
MIIMKVTSDMIHKELRLNGTLMRTFLSKSSEKKFKKMQKLVRKVIVGYKSKRIRCEEVTIEKTDGSELRLCIYSPLSEVRNVPGFLWIHGGGYAIGAPEMDIPYAEKFINAKKCVIVAPDYTLSTEKPYPAALEDCYEALLWMKENAETLGIRDDQLFVGGESAGGGLTAALTLYARDKGEVNIAFQIPLYPMIDDRMKTDSMQDNDAPIWNYNSNSVAWKMYLGDLYETKQVPKYAAAARETDYSNLPPTYTFVGDIEPFYDETLIYIDNLKQAGVPADVTVYKGCYHGFDAVSRRAEISKTANEKLVQEYVYAVESYFAKQK